MGVESVSTRERYFRKEKQYKDIVSLQSVDFYFTTIVSPQSVDFHFTTSSLVYTAIKIRSSQWYRIIFFHIIDMCLVNAWLLWQRKSEVYMSFYDIKLAISENYCMTGKSTTKKLGWPSAVGTTN